eukprot:scaffold23795_cov30-Tisochrysis_lutea.AAC.2
MERAPPPALAAAALAAMDEAFMDTPLSPKRPRQDDTPDQVGAGASGPRPGTTENNATKAYAHHVLQRQLARLCSLIAVAMAMVRQRSYSLLLAF